MKRARMLHHPGSSLRFPTKEGARARHPTIHHRAHLGTARGLSATNAVESSAGLSPRPRIPDRIVFEKLFQVLVFGCAYEKIADPSCSASTLRRRRDEWIASGVIDLLCEMALEAYDRMVGLEPSELAVDTCITKA